MRVYELAKELKMDSRRLLDLLHRLHEDVKNHMSTLEEPVVQQVRDIVAGKLPVAPPPEKPKAEAPRPARVEGPGAGLESPSGWRAPVGTETRDGRQGGPPNRSGAHRPEVKSPGKGLVYPIGPRNVGSGVVRPPVTRSEGGSARPYESKAPGGAPGAGPRPYGPRNGGGAPGVGARPYTGPRTGTATGGARPPYRPPGYRPPGGEATAGRGGARPDGANKPGGKPSPAGPPAKSPQAAKGPAKGPSKRFQGKDRVGIEAATAEKKLQQQRMGRQREGRAVQTEKRGTIELGGPLTVKELAGIMQIASTDVIKNLIKLGVMAGINQEIDSETAAIVASEYGFDVVEKLLTGPEPEEIREEDDPASLVARPPVVTVMGHVDHGKTSLLDAIRKTKVTSSEAGGITQHIGASTASVGGRSIVFLDTPGHEAFTAMRARGAKVTDVAVLVVAANDGVMPQTVEALNHAKAASIPIVVAVNKIDLPDANPERVKQQLTEHGLVSEEWGGDTIFVPVSAKSGTGLDKLLETILLVAEIQELRANPSREARGTVIEAELDKGRGPLATVLIQNGTLKIGDAFVAGLVSGKVRAMFDGRNKRIKQAGPSTPVEVIGFEGVPEAGDLFLAVNDEKRARELAGGRKLRRREEDLRLANRGVNLKDVFQRIKEGEAKELSLIVKGDVQGSVEAIGNSLQRLSNQEVKVRILHNGVGGITESDVMLATASKAIIIGFNVRPDGAAQRLAERDKVDIRTYRVIYEAVDDIEKAMGGMLEPVLSEVVQGHAEVRAVFKVPKIGAVAGCYVNDGKINKNAVLRVVRDGKVVNEGRIASLKRFKDDVKEVATGFECGIGLERFGDVKEGDVLEAFVMEETSRS